jgi:hypothetical protein
MANHKINCPFSHVLSEFCDLREKCQISWKEEGGFLREKFQELWVLKLKGG